MSESVNNNVTNYEVDGKIHTGNDDDITSSRTCSERLLPIEEISKRFSESLYQKKKKSEEIYNSRIEALKLATEVALRINHFDHRYEGGPDSPEFMNDLNLIYKIADHNLKYIIGEK